MQDSDRSQDDSTRIEDDNERSGLIPSLRERSNSQIEIIRNHSHLKVDLQDRMVQATFELAKQSFAHAKYKKTSLYKVERWLLQRLPHGLQKWLKRPNLLDFKRAYSLIQDWYPKLKEQVQVHGKTWANCNRRVLESMQYLLKNDIITVDDENAKEQTDAFNKWAEEMLKDMERNEESAEIHPDFPCFQEDPKVDVVQQNLQSMHALLSGADASTYASAHGRLMDMKAPVLRWLWIIMMLDLFFLFEAAALGFLTQIFFEMTVDVESAMKNGSDHKQLRHLWLVLLPFWVLVYSILGSEIGQLTHDAVHFPPLTNARASLIMMCTRAKTETILEGKIVRRPIRIMDFCLSDGLLLFSLIGAISFRCFWDEAGSEASSMDLILDGMNAGALLWAFLCFGFVTASHFYCIWLTHSLDPKHFNRRSGQRSSTTLVDVKFRPTRCVRVLRSAIEHYGMLPGATWTYFLPMQKFLEIHKHDDHVWQQTHVPEWLRREEKECPGQSDKPDGRVDWEAYSMKLAVNDSTLKEENKQRGCVFAGASMIIWLVTGGICWFLDAGKKEEAMFLLVTANVGLAITIALMSVAAEMLIPLIRETKWFRFHAFIFVACILAFSFATFELAIPPENLTAVMKYSEDEGAGRERGDRGVFYNDGRGVFYNDGSGSNDTVTPYPLCSTTWGRMRAKVHLLDLAAMSYYAYVQTETEFEQLLNESFGSAATNVYFTKFEELPRIVASRFCGSGNGTHGTEGCTLVMAVKGTSTKLEVMADLGIFSTITILQMLDKIGPLLGTLPQHIISFFLYLIRLPSLVKTQHKVVGALIKTVKELQKKYANDKLVLTGHSLGGIFAEVAAARLRIPAVGFSAPGHFYLMRSFKMTRESIIQNLVTIIPSLDPVPQLGSHLDVVQRILCRDRDGKYRQPLACHGIEATTCELWRVCGDEKLRNFSQTCLEPLEGSNEALVNKDCIGQSYSIGKEAKCQAVHT